MEKLGQFAGFAVMLCCAVGLKACVRENGWFWEQQEKPGYSQSLAPAKTLSDLGNTRPYEPLAANGPPLNLPTYDAPAERQSGSSYDYKSGNTYYWQRQADGTTTVQGSNARTGSMWNSQIEEDGDQRGMDSEGNLWSYDASTGFYSNTDGTTCFGKDELRTCY